MAGSITFTESRSRTVQSVSMLWVSSAAGAVSGIASPQISGEILRAVFSPGAAGLQPTDLYDVTLLDEDGFDVLAGKGANRSNVNKEQVTPLTGDGVTTNQRISVDGTLELQVANAGNAKSGTLTIYFR
ncbi:MAG: hypothetical protein UY96_C0034G0009 [Parcubacteria group bacterium GW2011_GWB1_56_8]|nr:MAG: hypothetical protein UY96_C0034G0009 [Parcubacteria group bacterium GW2011_GWB1_56_8]